MSLANSKTMTNTANRKSAASSKGRRKTNRSHALSTAALGCILAASGHVEAFPAAMVPLSSVRQSAESRKFSLPASYAARPGGARSRSYGKMRASRCHGDSDRQIRRNAAAFTALGYRVGDEEDCSSRQEQHDDAAASITGAPVAAPERPRQAQNPLSSVWDSIVVRKRKYLGRKGRSAREQFVLDDYLEFVDRRYNRLHDEDEKKATTNAPPQNDGINTAWNWLMQPGGGGAPSMAERQRQEDALEVLGLAELASAELLRKHHLPVPEDADPSMPNGSTTAVVIDAPVVSKTQEDKATEKKEVVAQLPSASSGRIATVSTAAVASRLAASVTALKRVQERNMAVVTLAIRSAMYNMVSASIRSARNAVEKVVPATAALLTMAGSSTAVKTTTAVAMALMVVVRPLGQAIVKSAQS